MAKAQDARKEDKKKPQKSIKKSDSLNKKRKKLKAVDPLP